MHDFNLDKKRSIYFAFLSEGSVEHATKAYCFLKKNPGLETSFTEEEIIDSYCNFRDFGKISKYSLGFFEELFRKKLKRNSSNTPFFCLENYYLAEKNRPREDSNL
jgi:hypothetical protein